MMINDGGPAFPVECSYTSDGKRVGLQTSSTGGWETGPAAPNKQIKGDTK